MPDGPACRQRPLLEQNPDREDSRGLNSWNGVNYEINSEARSKLIGMKKQHESNVSKVEWSPHSGNISHYGELGELAEGLGH